MGRCGSASNDEDSLQAGYLPEADLHRRIASIELCTPYVFGLYLEMAVICGDEAKMCHILLVHHIPHRKREQFSDRTSL